MGGRVRPTVGLENGSEITDCSGKENAPDYEIVFYQNCDNRRRIWRDRAGVRLKRAGFHDFVIFERAAEVGGVWRDNSYPGAAYDVPSRMYSFSFANDYPWSERFGQQPEILDYLKNCADRFGVRSHIRFNTEVDGAEFDAQNDQWHISIRDGGIETADMLVSAVGLFNQPLVPDLPGRETFNGPQFHSSRWDHDCSLDGKIVAGNRHRRQCHSVRSRDRPRVGQLLVCQRSPQYVLPRDERPIHSANGLWEQIRSRADRFGIYLEQERRTRRRGSARMTAQGQAAFLARLEREVLGPGTTSQIDPVLSAWLQARTAVERLVPSLAARECGAGGQSGYRDTH